ncbi:MAG: hypothetical protein ABI348_03675 [Nitrososphaera sp.]
MAASAPLQLLDHDVGMRFSSMFFGRFIGVKFLPADVAPFSLFVMSPGREIGQSREKDFKSKHAYPERITPYSLK